MLKSGMESRLDLDKLRRFFSSREEVEILIGFPSGMQHTDATHDKVKNKDGSVKTDAYGNVKRKGGNKITQETADLARELHFGSARIPARPFLKDGIEKHKKEIMAVYEREVEKNMPQWDRVGTMAVGQIKKFVKTSGYYKDNIPNSPATIERKKSEVPLVDSANLIESLTFIVNGKLPENAAPNLGRGDQRIAEDFSFDTYGDL